MKRKTCAALILSLNVTLALAANQAFGGFTWGPFGGLNVGVYGPDDIPFYMHLRYSLGSGPSMSARRFLTAKIKP
jgi:hypothetical protein